MLSVLLLALTALTLAGLSRLEVDAGPEAALPPGDQAAGATDRVARAFGGDALVVLLESHDPGGPLGEQTLPKLVGLEGELSRLSDVAAVYGPATALNQIATSSQATMAQIGGQRDALMAVAEQDARARGQSGAALERARADAVREFDARYGSLLARGLPAGLPTLHNPHFVRTVVFDPSGASRPQWQFMVPNPSTVAILVRPREELDQAGTERLVQAVTAAVDHAELRSMDVTVSGAPAVAAALGAQLRTEIPLLGLLAVVLIGASYALTPWRTRRRDRLIPLVVTLWSTGVVLAGFGWLGRPVSLGVIAFLPILLGIGSDFPAYLMHGSGRRRVVVAACASACGFGALAFSPIPFVRDLGLALAAGVAVAVVMFLLLTRLRTSPPPSPLPHLDPPAPGVRPSRRFRAAVLVSAAAAAVCGWVALPTLTVQAQPDRLLEGLPAVASAHHIENVLGSSGEFQVVLRGPDVVRADALAWLRAAQDTAALKYGDQLRPIASPPDLLDFLGPAATQEEIDAGVQALPSYLLGAVVSPDHTVAVIRFGIRLQDLGAQQRLIDGLANGLPPPPPDFQQEVAGLPVAAARGYELVSQGRYLGNALGIVMAGVVLLVGLRGRRADALRAVLAAVLATGWSLAASRLLGLDLTPMTMALGSLSAATACEFTIVLAGGNDRRGRLGRTVSVAALAACLGYAALAASRLAVIRDFGLLLASTVALSLLAAHLVLRALPAGERPGPEVGQVQPTAGQPMEACR